MHVFVVKKGKLIAYLMIICGALAAVITLFFFGSGVIAAMTGPQYYPVRSIETTQKEVAVTLDTVNNSDQNISLVYGFLDRYQVKATFFVTGEFVRQYRWEVEKMASSGHDVMNLSNQYRDLTGLSISDIAGDLSTSDEVIRNITLVKPTVFRPPMGAVNSRMIEAAKSLGYITVTSSVDSETIDGATWEKISAGMIDQIVNGAILRFRVGVTADVQSLDRVLKYLADNNYRVVPLSQLLFKDNYEIDSSGVQRRVNVTG